MRFRCGLDLRIYGTSLSPTHHTHAYKKYQLQCTQLMTNYIQNKRIYYNNNRSRKQMPSYESMRVIWKLFERNSFTSISLSLGWILNNCWLDIHPSWVIHCCHLLGSLWMASQNKLSHVNKMVFISQTYLFIIVLNVLFGQHVLTLYWVIIRPLHKNTDP